MVEEEQEEDAGLAYRHAAPRRLGGNLPSLLALRNVFSLTPALYERLIGIGVVAALFFKSSAELAQSFERTRFTTLATAMLVWLAIFFMNASTPKGFVYFAF